MKSLLTILSLAIIIHLTACKKDNSETITSLTGKWIMIGNYISAGGPQYYVPVNDYSSYVIFNTDGSVGGTAFGTFTQYSLKDSVTIYMVTADKSKYENYRYRIRHDTLTMSPAGPTFCIEGCSTLFIKQSGNIIKSK